MSREKFVWLDDPQTLLQHYSAFWPSPSMTGVERINAVSRFVLYAGVALAVYYRRLEVLALALVAAAAYAHLARKRVESYAPFVRPAPVSTRTTAAPRAPLQQTALNPFGNPLPGQSLDLDVQPFDPDQARNLYYSGLPRDTDDVNDRNTTPWNFAPLADRNGFPDFTKLARHLNDTKPTCKVDRKNCTGYN